MDGVMTKAAAAFGGWRVWLEILIADVDIPLRSNIKHPLCISNFQNITGEYILNLLIWGRWAVVPKLL